MQSERLPVLHSVFPYEALIERVLSNYDLRPPIECRFLQRWISDTYLVKANRSKSILRIYRHGWRVREQIEAELDFLNALHGKRIPVSRPIQREDGEYIQELNAPEGIRYAVLFTHARGTPRFRPNREQSYLYGKMAGEIHAFADSQQKQYIRYCIDFTHLVEEPLEKTLPFISHRKRDVKYLYDLAEKLKAKIEKLPLRSPEYGICHGDFHTGNLHITAQNKLTLFDFDLFGYSWRCYDVGVFLWILHVNSDPKWKSIWRAFLKDYRETRRLSKLELEMIPYFVAIRQYWWIGLCAGMVEEYSGGWIDDHFFDRQIRFIKEWVNENCTFD